MEERQSISDESAAVRNVIESWAALRGVNGKIQAYFSCRVWHVSDHCCSRKALQFRNSNRRGEMNR